MADTIRKVHELKKATKNLRAAQEELRLKRAEYNKAVNAVVEDDDK